MLEPMDRSASKPPKDVRFRSKVPMLHDNGQPVPEAWNLRCLHCEYDLTGLTIRRCPECGRTFDPYKIWLANRQKEVGLHFRTPAYIHYGGLCMIIALTFPLARAYPQSLLPMLVLPAYELAAWYFKWDAPTNRPTIMVLCLIAAVTIWTML